MEKHTRTVHRNSFSSSSDFAASNGNAYSSITVSPKFWPVIFTALRWLVLALLLAGWP